MRAVERAREGWRLLRGAGPVGLARRVSRAAYLRLGASELEFPLALEDVADSSGLRLAAPASRPAAGTPLTIGWVCTPPGPGSGGHTTLFRMVEAAEAAGHRCALYLYDRFDGELSRHERVIRRCWPRLRAEVRSVAAGLAPLDAYVASAWQTAHVLAARPELATRRLYFVQDFEPFFYPRGSEWALAEESYRFGFRTITVGGLLAGTLRDGFGVTAAVAEFGCDTGVYRVTNPDARSAVVCYLKRDAPRRGFALCLLALRAFHRDHPDHEIHLFGDGSIRPPFPATNHGTLSPAALSELYNQCAAGLALSFTNVSLVPDEMLACGVVPVVAESPHARACLTNDHVRWVRPAPARLAAALGEIVTGCGRPSPAEVSKSVAARDWSAAARVTVATIENEVYG